MALAEVTFSDFDQMDSRGRYLADAGSSIANVGGLGADRNSRRRPITHLRSKQPSRSLPLLAHRVGAERTLPSNPLGRI